MARRAPAVGKARASRSDSEAKVEAQAQGRSAVAVDRLHFERLVRAEGHLPIAGVDEVGRGPLAGPVVAAAVVLPLEWLESGPPPELASLNDSKQLTESQRESFFARLPQEAGLRFAVAIVDHLTIDRLNILQATHRAMNEALAQLAPAPGHVLVDGLRVPTLRFPQTPLVKGDSRSYSIAAASVFAKVTRDRLMLEAHQRWPGYGFDRHKGYPTPEHLDALQRLGPCPWHRRSFAPLRPSEPELFPL